ncbi:hypothetical protein MHBO_000399 [Bonamia ostreae]|uniref:NAD-dependent epimerase/dehydratase domain-containing protein n=1 Tax=Bonamia ostreae TaxID=126728 RepID=A0ABV2AFI6_9EUKA
MVKNILIAGGTGFLGSRIAKDAIKRKFVVTSISRSPVKNVLKEVNYQFCDLAKISCSDAIGENKLGSAKTDFFDAGVYSVGELFGLKEKPFLRKLLFPFLFSYYYKNNVILTFQCKIFHLLL